MQGQPPDLLWLVCPNGMGHAARSVAIATALLARAAERRVPAPSIVIRCSSRAASRLSPGVSGIAYTADDRGAEYPWSGPDRAAAARAIESWESALASESLVMSARVMVCDNVGTALAARHDAVLAGSFLWSTELDGYAPEFVARERELLARYRPPMLCVGDLAMPDVLVRTRAVPVGWMCADAEPDAPATKRVALIDGADSPAAPWIAAAATAAAEAGFAIAPGPRPDLRTVSAAIARPGAGVLTDCVAHGVPVLAVAEPGSREMAHNAGRVAALGIGRAPIANGPPNPAWQRAVADALRTMHGAAAATAHREALSGLRRGGLREAADWLLARLAASGRGAGKGGRGA